jgi:hypothetical protein
MAKKCPRVGKCVPDSIGTVEDFLDKMYTVHGDTYMYYVDEDNYNGRMTIVTAVCPKHGDFDIRANLLEKGDGCPTCKEWKEADSRNRWQWEKGVDPLRGIWGSIRNSNGLKEVFDLVIKERNVDVTTVPDVIDYSDTGVDESVIFICPTHGGFKSTPREVLRDFIHRTGNGCERCRLDGRHAKMVDDRSKRQILLEDIREEIGELYDWHLVPIAVYPSLSSPGESVVQVRCHSHGDMYLDRKELLSGSVKCPGCERSEMKRSMLLIDVFGENEEPYSGFLTNGPYAVPEAVLNAIDFGCSLPEGYY